MEIQGPTSHAVTLKVYPGATHAFDADGVNFEVMGHKMISHPAATRDAVARVQAFLAKHIGGEDR